MLGRSFVFIPLLIGLVAAACSMIGGDKIIDDHAKNIIPEAIEIPRISFEQEGLMKEVGG